MSYKSGHIYLVDKEPTNEELANFSKPVQFDICKNGLFYSILYDKNGNRYVEDRSKITTGFIKLGTIVRVGNVINIGVHPSGFNHWRINGVDVTSSNPVVLELEPETVLYRIDSIVGNSAGGIFIFQGDANKNPLPTNSLNYPNYAFFTDVLITPNSVGSSVFTKDFPVRIPAGAWIGKYKNGDTIPGIGKTHQEVWEDVTTALIPPTYTKPTASFASSSTSTANIEVGQTLVVTVNGQFNQNDGGSATAHRIYKGSTKVADANTFSESVTFGTNSISYGYEVDYEAGPVKNDNLGNPYPTGQINGGTTNRDTITYTPNSKIFYGVAGAGVTDFRTLPNWAWKGTTALTIATGTTLKDFYIVVPSDKSVTSVIDVESSNNEILPQFAETTVSVNDAGGTGRSYKLYKWPAGSAYPTNHTLKITIG